MVIRANANGNSSAERATSRVTVTEMGLSGCTRMLSCALALVAPSVNAAIALATLDVTRSTCAEIWALRLFM